MSDVNIGTLLKRWEGQRIPDEWVGWSIIARELRRTERYIEEAVEKVEEAKRNLADVESYLVAMENEKSVLLEALDKLVPQGEELPVGE